MANNNESAASTTTPTSVRPQSSDSTSSGGSLQDPGSSGSFASHGSSFGGANTSPSQTLEPAPSGQSEKVPKEGRLEFTPQTWNTVKLLLGIVLTTGPGIFGSGWKKRRNEIFQNPFIGIRVQHEDAHDFVVIYGRGTKKKSKGRELWVPISRQTYETVTTPLKNLKPWTHASSVENLSSSIKHMDGYFDVVKEPIISWKQDSWTVVVALANVVWSNQKADSTVGINRDDE